ncbi:transposase [Thalassotalea piscium]|uniref:Transposase-like protein n=1 Tax=Thalassotalea piscium TaxID=1230533 RepID=A0A7X0TVE5_9GAMM|nr:transposase-like protein [Thalassotalea piscium]
MKHYPEDHKKAVIRKLIESGLSLRQFAKLESINLSTLYSWRDKYLKAGSSLTDSNNSNGWSPEQKFSIVLETATLSEIELSEYCREKGLYPEKIKEWKQSCIAGNQTQAQQRKQLIQERKVDRKRIKELEKELKRKEAALAETAALLVLRKKLNAYWGEDEDS